MFKSFTGTALGFIILSLLVAGCSQPQTGDQQVQPEETLTYERGVAVIHPTDGNDISGTVTLERTAEGTRITAEITGLDMGKHGFHIHEYGNCTASDGTSAGGHYNPENVPHASPTSDVRHVGDMGNLVANDEGLATIDYTDSYIKLNGPKSVIGRAIIIHSGEDDFSSQPTGAAGARLGCGVIGVDSTSTGM